jgi:STE24 endopeptidase
MSEMTATRLAKGSTLVALAAGWVVAGWLLWQTTVPGNLHLEHLDPHDFFSDALLRRSAHFDTFLRWEWVAATVVELATLVALSLAAPRIVRAFELGRVGSGVMVGAVATVALWLVGLPFGFLGLWWGRHYGLEKQTYGEWLLAQWPSLIGQVVGLTILLTILLLLAGWLRRLWWLVAGPLLVGIGALIVFVLPYAITIGTRGPHHTKLAAQIREIARREGVGGTPLRIEKVSGETRAANAMAIGLGPSARIFLWDTLLTRPFTPGEVRVVAAHEYGHIARRHIWKGLGWSALITIPGFLVLAEATRRRGGMARPEVVPFALLVILAFNLAVTPFTNAVSRRYEAEADWRALVTTHDTASAERLFRHFAFVDLEQPNPPGWSYVWIDNHPTLMQRIAMARAFRARER